MTDQVFACVWDAIEATSAQAKNMKLRSSLMMAIIKHIKSNGLNQTQAAKLFGVTQPRISDLMRGKINLFSIDTLVAILSSAGLQIEMKIQRAVEGYTRCQTCSTKIKGGLGQSHKRGLR
jgi:predicted XRE-type DNA-binding protein